MGIDHTSGDRFLKNDYSLDDLTQTMNEIAKTNTDVLFDMRIIYRMEDLGLSPIEVHRAVKSGEVIASEVTASKWEIRLLVHLEGGDMNDFYPVMWLTKELQLSCGDIRDSKM